jgi:3-ketosteroid 9alpha-monooxygenase subunit A
MATMTADSNRPTLHDPDRSEWPYDDYPRGWFQIGWSGDVTASDLHLARAFGQDLILFRDNAGAVCALDAYCPHLGANLGYGGRVVDGNVECPFHGWQWKPDGTNARIPYAEKPNRAQRIRSWPSSERDGLVYIWSGPDAPSWEVPSLSQLVESAGLQAIPTQAPHDTRSWDAVRMYPQLLSENLVDSAHFRWVHSAKDPTDILEYEAEGPFFRAVHSFPSVSDVRATIVAGGVGVNFGIFARRSALSFVEVQCVTPVSETYSDVRASIWLARTGDGPINEDEQRAMEFQHAEFAKDLAIWENMRYVRRPPLTASEARPFKSLRSWAAQFYPTISPSFDEAVTHSPNPEGIIE